MSVDYQCRRVQSDRDRDFLWQLKVATMKQHIEATFGWDEPLARKFLEKTMPGALVVMVGDPAGILKLVGRDTHLYLAELGLLPSFQKKGLGKRILQDSLVEAANRKLPLRLQVLKVNPAHKFYSRFGFSIYAETATHYEMEAPSGRVPQQEQRQSPFKGLIVEEAT